MKRYRIAEITVEMEPKFEPLLTQSSPYLYSGPDEPVLNISLTEQKKEKMLARYPGTADALLEYMGTGGTFYTLLLYYQGMMLHASAVELNGKAYLFSAPSGTGKSTHTSLWLKEFPAAQILNDDKPALKYESGVFYAYGTPWSGKTDLALNHKIPVQGIAFLERSEKNEIAPLSKSEAIPLLMEQTVRPGNAPEYEMMLKVLDLLLRTVPLYKLKCNMDPEAAHVSYQAMKEGTKK